MLAVFSSSHFSHSELLTIPIPLASCWAIGAPSAMSEVVPSASSLGTGKGRQLGVTQMGDLQSWPISESAQELLSPSARDPNLGVESADLGTDSASLTLPPASHSSPFRDSRVLISSRSEASQRDCFCLLGSYLLAGQP